MPSNFLKLQDMTLHGAVSKNFHAHFRGFYVLLNFHILERCSSTHKQILMGISKVLLVYVR